MLEDLSILRKKRSEETGLQLPEITQIIDNISEQNLCLNGNSSDDSSRIDPVAVSTSTTSSSGQISKSKQSRFPISILPDDPKEKRKHIIGLVLEKFPYLSLDDSDECRNPFNLDSSTLCPLCKGDYKEKRSIFDGIKGEWGAGEYYGE
ncbi:unnamed protein product [Rhizophagus irregularis]|nr:unnamed protein product [Rhizophagus irregularis]